MPNLTNFLKNGKAGNNGNNNNGGGEPKKGDKSQSNFSLLGGRKDASAASRKNSVARQTDTKSPVGSPCLGLFRRYRLGKSSTNLLHTGSQSCILECSSTSVSSCGSPLRSPANLPNRSLGGMPKCSTVANFNTVRPPPAYTEPQKCSSMAVFFTGPEPPRSSACSLQNSRVSLGMSRCSSRLSCVLSRCLSNASFLPSMSRNNSSCQFGAEGSSGGGGAASVLCRLCLCDYSPADTVELKHCSCRYCRFCLQQYVFFQIMDGNVNITCPDGCCERKGELAKEEIEHLVDSEIFERYQRYLLNNEVDLDPHRTWCPRAGCETICTVAPAADGSSSPPTCITCSTCLYKFCSGCKSKWHANLTCEAYAWQRSKLTDGDGDLILSDDENASIKRCPHCKLLIERDDGCAQMMCKRCKHVFCWYCLVSLDDDFLLRHYDKGPCKNKLGHSRASVFWHRTQVVGIFAGFGLLLLMASPFLLLLSPCILCSNCSRCKNWSEEDNSEPTSSSS